MCSSFSSWSRRWASSWVYKLPELDVVIVFVIVKELGVVFDIFFIHFEVFLVLDVLLAWEHTD